MPLAPDHDAPGHEFRSLILSELASRDLSRSWLADRVASMPDSCTRANVMHYLRGAQDCSGRHLWRMMSALGLVVTRY